MGLCVRSLHAGAPSFRYHQIMLLPGFPVGNSRFGKFVEIQFDHAKRISGAAVRTYLLERSRVVQIADPERNYHCFYEMIRGSGEADRARRGLAGGVESFRYLTHSSCTERQDGVEDAQQWARLLEAMFVLAFTSEVVPFPLPDSLP